MNNPGDSIPSIWNVRCIHPDFVSLQIDIDYGELAVGSDLSDGPRRKNHRWKGRFSGRPGLLADLFPMIRAKQTSCTPHATRFLRSALREFWRFLDGYEEMCARSGVALGIKRLSDVTGAMVQLFSQPGPDNLWGAASHTIAKNLRALIADSIFDAGIPEIMFSSLPNKIQSPKDTPTDEEGLAIIRHFRFEAKQVFRRWNRADELAKQGRNLLDLQRSGTKFSAAFETPPSEADAHATYRALIEHTGSPLPSVRDLNKELGVSTRTKCLPTWWPRHTDPSSELTCIPGRPFTFSELAAGIYPTTTDVLTIGILFLARTAWNPATVSALDILDWSGPYDEDHRWIYSRKERSNGAYQYGISKLNHRTGAYRLVTDLIERLAPLRVWAIDNPKLLTLPDMSTRSPWLGVSTRFLKVVCVFNPTDTQVLNEFLMLQINKYNAQPGTKIQVRKMTAGDFRDVAAAVMYRESRYSTWVLMVMLGHANLANTHRYGFRHAGKQESHRLVVEVMNDVLEQIEVHRIWDPALTRAKIEGVEISADALENLIEHRKNRTYSGNLCLNPTNPPREIDPTHPRDNRSICVQQHRCVAAVCPLAILLNDSAPYLARRVAELEWNEKNVGMVRFHVASDAHDLIKLRATLQQWPKEQVNSLLDDWRGRIDRGEHRPQMFGGQH